MLEVGFFPRSNKHRQLQPKRLGEFLYMFDIERPLKMPNSNRAEAIFLSRLRGQIVQWLMDKVSTFLTDEALEGVLLVQKTY